MKIFILILIYYISEQTLSQSLFDNSWTWLYSVSWFLLQLFSPKNWKNDDTTKKCILVRIWMDFLLPFQIHIIF